MILGLIAFGVFGSGNLSAFGPIYEVWVDSYANGDPSNDHSGFTSLGLEPRQRGGGDLKGIELHISDISGQGTQTIEIDGAIGHDSSGNWGVDPHAGTVDDLATCIDLFHREQMKVIVSAPVWNDQLAELDQKVKPDGWALDAEPSIWNSRTKLILKGHDRPPMTSLRKALFQSPWVVSAVAAVLSRDDATPEQLQKAIQGAGSEEIMDTSDISFGRFGTMIKESNNRQLALALLFVLPGQVSLFSGDELGMMGGAFPATVDPYPWGATSQSVYKTLIQALAPMAQNRRSLRAGDFEVSLVDGDQDEKCLVITRTYRLETTVFVANLSTKSQNVRLPSATFGLAPPTTLYGGQGFGVDAASVQIGVGPRGFSIVGTPAT